MNRIEVKELTKRYGETLALDNISLFLEEDKIYGLLGRNGAGKTTLLNLMTNKIFPTNGQIFIGGAPVHENNWALSRIFYMSEQNLYPPSSRVMNMFKWTGEFYRGFDLDYALRLAERFELNTRKKMKELSTGYASIFKAILTLASGAEILLFDEPILGLDPIHRDMLYKEILANYIEHPKTIILSTHLIDEIADILEEVMIIKNGKLIIKQPTEELLASAYMVSGEVAKVDQYIKGKNCVGEETLHNSKSIIVLAGERDDSLARSLDLTLGKVELQKLFIGLTSA
ncbi:MAG TPA: ABC transporter ATP-binding protein [Firmicutes bacterium]|jgi:ABC-2 type transport system ATP-binding protein|nr:ABC transporter ATP-binding protein [Bacillota bacterium]